jgi:hypothetical protein
LKEKGQKDITATASGDRSMKYIEIYVALYITACWPGGLGDLVTCMTEG